MDLQKLKSKAFDRLSAYVPGEQPQDLKGWIKLNTNENAYEPPTQFMEEYKARIGERLRAYPDPNALVLRKTILEDFLIPEYNAMATPRSIICGVGADEILDILFKAFIDEGDTIITFQPSYGMYDVLAKTYQATTKVVRFREDFTLPEISDIPAEGKLLILCSPNNPTGIRFPNSEIQAICKHFKGLVIVDEAYTDFSTETALSLLHTTKNLVIVRTFSKSFSLAGIRLGYAQASPEIIALLDTIRLPINIPFPTQLAGILAIKHKEHFKKQNQLIIQEREKMSAALNALDNISVVPSEANFILIQIPTLDLVPKVLQRLKDQKILIRHYNVPGCEQYLRMTIGTPEQNAVFLQAFQRIITEITA